MLENILFSEAVLAKLLLSNAAVTVAKLPVSTAFIDVSAYARFAFLIAVGATNSELTFQVQQDKSATQTAGVKNVTNAVVVVPADGDDKWYLIEVETSQLDKSGFKYVTLNMTGAAGGDDLATVFFLGFGDKAPVTQGADKGSIVTLAG